MDPNEFLNETLETWAIQFIQNRASDASNAKLKGSGDLIKSFARDLKKADANGVASVFFAFEGYGRFWDLKKMKKPEGGQQLIQQLIQWIKAEGVQKFSQGFARKYKIPVSSETFLNKIAWGIVKSKKRRKRRKWYSSNREKDIQQLYTLLSRGYATNTLSDLKTNTANGIKKG